MPAGYLPRGTGPEYSDRLLAENRVASGESYVARGAALNELLSSPRVSRDIDLFHDTDEALAASWRADRKRLLFHPGRIRGALPTLKR